MAMEVGEEADTEAVLLRKWLETIMECERQFLVKEKEDNLADLVTYQSDLVDREWGNIDGLCDALVTRVYQLWVQ